MKFVPILLLASLLATSGCRGGASTRSEDWFAPVAPDSTQSLSAFGASLNRNWATPMAVLPRAQRRGDKVKVYQVRNFRYASADTFVPDYYDRVYDLDKLAGVDFVVVPFRRARSLAHTMLSFVFEDGNNLAVSVEARLERGESYSPLGGALNQYELMYVVADERDVIPLRSEHRDSDVYIYRTKATPEEARQLLADVLDRVNRLAQRPEYYHTLTNNCTTNLLAHVNKIRPGRVAYGWQVLFNGHSDRLAYDLGLLDSDKPFEQTRRLAWSNDRVRQALATDGFSAQIRR